MDDRATVDWVVATYEKFAVLSEHWRAIAAEASALDRSFVYDTSRDDKNNDSVAREMMAIGEPKWMCGWGPMRDHWLTWGIAYRDTYPFGDAMMPQTAALLKRVRGIKVAAVSLFLPETLIGLHAHPALREEGMCIYHPGLHATPGFAGLCVGKSLAFERPGHGLCFDGAIPHYAFNAAPSDRLILYCEFESGGARVEHSAPSEAA